MAHPHDADPTAGPLAEPEAQGILNSLLGDLPGIVYRCRNDPEWTMVALTENVEDLTGYTVSELVGRRRPTWRDLIHPEDRARVWEGVQAGVENDQPFRLLYRIVTREGRVRWILEQGRAVEDGGEVVLTGYIQEITDTLAHRLAETEQELQAARREARGLELLHRVTRIINRERTLRSALDAVLPEVARALGFQVGHVFMGGEDGVRSSELWHLAEGVEGLHLFREATEAGGWDADRGLPGRVMAGGGVVWVEDVGADPHFRRVGEDRVCPVESGLGAPVLSGDQPLAVIEFYSVERREKDPEVVALLEQIGVQLGRVWERETAERERLASEARFRTLIENSVDVIGILDEGLVARYASPSVEGLLGYRPEEIVGTDVRSRIHPDDRQAAMEALRALVQEPGAAIQQSHRLIHRDGSPRHVESQAQNLLHDPNVQGIVVNLRDVTEEKELERQLLQAQKMEAIGRLAGGIAHDFNNLLTVIRGQADVLLMDLDEDDATAQELRVVRDAADRAARLTQQLLALGREQVLRPAVVDLSSVVAETRELLRRVLGEDITIDARLTPGLPPVRLDPGQLQQVVMNLALNARDAMPRGGTLRLATWAEEGSAEDGEERRVFLGVRDTGVGMDEEILSQIFEPFFSTKAETGGTGLGLSTSYGIVQQSGGSIQVESVPGQGTHFTLSFPATDEAAEAPPTEAPRPAETEGRGTTADASVLVVEDDPSVRRVARKILEREGFRVRVAADAEGGLAIVEEDPDALDLVLTDLVLPGAGGRSLVDRLRVDHPRLGVVVMSGYAEGSPGSRKDLPDDVAFIQKPFTPQALVEIVRQKLVRG